jgi:hypothetical protein
MAILDMSIDNFINDSGIGSRDKAFSNLLYGTNHNRIDPNIQTNQSTYGWVFFTRPQLNLRTYNIRNVRKFYPLLSNNPLSIQRYVRVMLDPRLPHKLHIRADIPNFYNHEPIDTPLVDKFNPFIPILTNSVITTSGWPDEVTPIYSTTQGIRKEQLSMVDGTFETNDSVDISVTFKNYINDPLTTLFQTWGRYPTFTLEGTMNPYWDMALENELDYNTRIYRILTDSKWEYLTYIAATGASIPSLPSTGKMFDFNKDKPYNEQTKEVNIRFKSDGVDYNDDILIYEFNKVHTYFNPSYKKYMMGDKSSMDVIPNELKPILNFRGYPFINANNYKIEWLLNKSSKSYANAIKTLSKASSDELDYLYKQNNDTLGPLGYNTQDKKIIV